MEKVQAKTKRNMIKYVKRDILKSEAQALVNPVNIMGVMGKGLALLFKKHFPNNYNLYVKACKRKEIGIGKLFVTQEKRKIIINFPTKTDWYNPSTYEYIERGLDDLVRIINEYNIKSIAIPALGAGCGKLKWEKVKKLIEEKLKDLKCDVIVFEPFDSK